MSTQEKQPLISSKCLPVPRLELRWDDEGTPSGWGEFRRGCRYLLVMPLCKTDIRRDWATDRAAPAKSGDAWEVEMGNTGCSGGWDAQRIWLDQCRVDMPFRDGRHAQWDSHSLRLPAYATCGDLAMFIEPEAPPVFAEQAAGVQE